MTIGGSTSSSRTWHQGRSASSPTGNYYEHSIDWSPNGDEILFVSNREARSGSLLQLRRLRGPGGDGTIRRLTDTKSAEYRPSGHRTAASSPISGTKRDAHVLGNDDGGYARLGDGRRRDRSAGRSARIDNRQGAPEWSRRRRLFISRCRSAGGALDRAAAGGRRAGTGSSPARQCRVVVDRFATARSHTR